MEMFGSISLVFQLPVGYLGKFHAVSQAGGWRAKHHIGGAIGCRCECSARSCCAEVIDLAHRERLIALANGLPFRAIAEHRYGLIFVHEHVRQVAVNGLG